MSKTALLILFVRNIKSLLAFFVTVVLVRLYRSDNGLFEAANVLEIAAVLTALIAYTMALTFAQYFTKKFHVKDGDLIFTHGLLHRHITTIPLTKIHSLRTRQGAIYRLLEMRGIIFDTLASKTVELELILEESDWQHLLVFIEKEEISIETENVDDNLQQAAKECHDTSSFRIIKFGELDLIKDAFCQNHLKGFAILFAFMVAVIDNVSDIADDTMDSIVNYAESHLDDMTLFSLDVCLFLVIIYMIALLLWLCKTFLHYGDMTLRYDKLALNFNYGVIAHSSSRIAHDKVCTLWVKKNALEKKFNLCSLMLRQALNATAMKENDTLKIYGIDRSDFFLKWWLGEDYKSTPIIADGKSGRGVFLHTIIQDLIVIISATVMLCYFQLYSWLAIPVFYVPISLAKGYFATRRSRIVLYESYIMICNGCFADIRNYLKYSDIEVVRIRRSPVFHWFQRVSLSVSTPGTTFTVRSLPLSTALRIHSILTQP